MENLILASDSIRRVDLLKECGIDFIKVRHKFNENSLVIKDPVKFVRILADGKAASVADIEDFQNDYVLGVDTIVVHNGIIFGKPADIKQAESFVRALSGQKHMVITGISLINREKGIKITNHAVTTVYFNKISEKFIKYYLDNNHWEGYSGGYAIQGIFSLVVKKISGSYTNIVGLPLELLYKILNKINYKIKL